MGQAEVIIDLIQGQLLPYASLVFAQRRDAPSNSGDMLTEVKIEALDEGGVDVPAAHREHLVHRLQRPVVYLHPADKSPRLTHRPSQGQKGLEERAIMASQRPSPPW